MCSLGFAFHTSHIRVGGALGWKISLRKGYANLNKHTLPVKNLQNVLKRNDQATVE
jgi:hypothetical protein